MRITRTYPQPDSPAPNIGPRERAMAVYKYLLGTEPEDAVKHPLFACIVHAFEQEGRRAINRWAAHANMPDYEDPDPSLVAELSSSRELPTPVTPLPDEVL